MVFAVCGKKWMMEKMVDQHLASKGLARPAKVGMGCKIDAES